MRVIATWLLECSFGPRSPTRPTIVRAKTAKVRSRMEQITKPGDAGASAGPHIAHPGTHPLASSRE
jgi:hypothetical protein